MCENELLIYFEDELDQLFGRTMEFLEDQIAIDKTITTDVEKLQARF